MREVVLLTLTDLLLPACLEHLLEPKRAAAIAAAHAFRASFYDEL
jgi:hypothetical protein